MKVTVLPLKSTGSSAPTAGVTARIRATAMYDARMSVLLIGKLSGWSEFLASAAVSVLFARRNPSTCAKLRLASGLLSILTDGVVTGGSMRVQGLRRTALTVGVLICAGVTSAAADPK